MKHILLLLICLYAHTTFCQDEATYNKTLEIFQENFNAQNVDAVFNLYTTEMQEAMTKEGITRFVNGCYTQFGNLKNLIFVETAEGVNSYTAEFDKISLLMEVQLSADGKIATIQFQEP
ncbi:DUF3887 domain-containing protein [Aquimarina sp. D1M17]|uniref:DUF3887 domain-containing protein n=1 Tax=Aquimarina acroporae TaxID=2937283 RepID=UPI0020BEEA19|nr:DUF3887 domain-containing protein [Aquimarina acroporae]MCK8524019.1 DUF3887 domain-containing protein [Aquimarina acroporae]